jgi:hypothetical protein
MIQSINHYPSEKFSDCKVLDTIRHMFLLVLTKSNHGNVVHGRFEGTHRKSLLSLGDFLKGK